MEAWTIGKVSPAARRLWKEMGRQDRSFLPCHGGFRMIGWESEIAVARAMGAGVHNAQGKKTHRYDIGG